MQGNALINWIIDSVDNANYRKGALTGWKHPKVDAKMIAAVGGHAALLQQAKEIEDDPVLGNSEDIWFDWRDMKGDIQTIHFQIAAIPLLCKRVGREDAREHQKKLIEMVQSWRDQTRNQTRDQSNQESWILKYYEEMLASLRKGNKTPEAEDEAMLHCMNCIAAQDTFIWENAFSTNVFGNSKVFRKQYKTKVISALQKYSPYYVDEMSSEKLLAMHNIHSYAQILQWKGKVAFQTDYNGTIVAADSSAFPYGIVLNSQTMEHAKIMGTLHCKKVITIENKANYMQMPYDPDVIYIFCHGFFTQKEIAFLKQIKDAAGDACEYLHWGDMDYGGINIFEFIKNHIFPDIKPYLMDKESFYKAIQAGYSVKLKPETREKLLGKDAGMLEELKQCILETNMTIEQEIFLKNL